jgi:hypothetical protein
MTAPAHPSGLLTIPEAAPLLRISERSAYRAIKAGTFPVPLYRPTPHRVFVSRTMIDRYLATGVPIATAVAS